MHGENQLILLNLSQYFILLLFFKINVLYVPHSAVLHTRATMPFNDASVNDCVQQLLQNINNCSLQHFNTAAEVKQVTTSYSERVYYQTFMHDVGIINGQNSEMMHHQAL